MKMSQILSFLLVVMALYYMHSTATVQDWIKRLLSVYIQAILAFMLIGCQGNREIGIAIAKTPYEIIEYPLLEVMIRYRHGGKETTISWLK